MSIHLSDLNNKKAKNIIYDDTYTSLGASNVETAINKLHDNLVTVSGSGSGSVVPKYVSVDPDADEIDGKNYTTWSAADAYIQTQSPSASNRWIIKLGGVCTENIVVRSYVTILGVENATILTGSLTSTVSYVVGMDTTQAKVINCIIENLATSSPMEFIQTDRCYLAGGTPTAGFVQVFSGALSGGNYSNMTVFQLFSSMVVGGILHKDMTCINSELYNGYTIQGGDFTNCLIMNNGNVTVNTLANYKLDRCKIEYDITFSDYYMYIDTCTFKNSPTFTVGPLGMLTTKNCSPDFNVAGTLNNWQNFGEYYDNRKTNIDVSTVQDAIDKLGNTKEVINVVSISSGHLNVDMNFPNNKIVLTENVSSMAFVNTDAGISRTKLLITQNDNYTMDFSTVQFHNGIVPDLNKGAASKFIIEIIYDGSGGGTYGIILGENMS